MLQIRASEVGFCSVILIVKVAVGALAATLSCKTTNNINALGPQHIT